jgi:hypothetical protein
MKTESTSFTVKDILSIEVSLALGCTEPVAIALSAAASALLLPDRDPFSFLHGAASSMRMAFGN